MVCIVAGQADLDENGLQKDMVSKKISCTILSIFICHHDLVQKQQFRLLSSRQGQKLMSSGTAHHFLFCFFFLQQKKHVRNPTCSDFQSKVSCSLISVCEQHLCCKSAGRKLDLNKAALQQTQKYEKITYLVKTRRSADVVERVEQEFSQDFEN